MWKAAILAASTTGLFCAGFAFAISQFAPMLSNSQVLATSFVSGFIGSIIARLLLDR